MKVQHLILGVALLTSQCALLNGEYWDNIHELRTVLRLLDSQANTSEDLEFSIATSARQLHEDSRHVDLHADTLVWVSPTGESEMPYARFLSDTNRRGNVDLPRLKEGNMTIQVLSVPNRLSVDGFCRGRGDSLPFCESPADVLQSEFLASHPNTEIADVVRDPYGYGDYVYPWKDDPPLDYSASTGPDLYRDIMTYESRAMGWPCATWWDAENGVWQDLDEKSVGCGNDNAMLDLSRSGFYGVLLDIGQYKNGPAYSDRSDMYLERLLYVAQMARDMEIRSRYDHNAGELKLIRNTKELEALLSEVDAPVGILLATEGLFFHVRRKSDGSPDLQRLDADFLQLFEAGYRMMGLAHGMDSDFAPSSTGLMRFDPSHPGLSIAGRHLLQLMFTHGVIPDLAHMEGHAIDESVAIALIAGRSVVYSHGGVQGFSNPRDSGNARDECNSPRNITPDQARSIARTGGVLGIGLWPHADCGTRPIDFALKVKYVVQLIEDMKDPASSAYDPTFSGRGVEHVSVGSDFDGGVKNHISVDQLAALTQALTCSYAQSGNQNCLDYFVDSRASERAGHTVHFSPFSPEEARLILGDNALRVFRQSLPE